MTSLTDVMTADLNDMFTILKVGIGFAVFYFIFNHFFNDLLITNKKNKKIHSSKKNRINNNEKIKSNVKVSLKK